MSNVVPFPIKSRKPDQLQHRRIKLNWHLAKVPGAAFFGYSKTEVVGRARQWLKEQSGKQSTTSQALEATAC